MIDKWYHRRFISNVRYLKDGRILSWPCDRVYKKIMKMVGEELHVRGVDDVSYPLHCIDQPALIGYDNKINAKIEEYYLDGLLHRANGPALIHTSDIYGLWMVSTRKISSGRWTSRYYFKQRGLVYTWCAN